jgi:Barstar (barnase inhibitor)
MMGFALVDDDDLERIAEASDVTGFFVPRAPEPRAWRTFELVGCRLHRALKAGRDLGNAELRVLDVDGRDLGGYYVGAVTVEQVRPNAADGELVDFVVTGLLLAQPHPLAGEVWARFRSGPPAERNRWAEYSVAGRTAWLEVVRLYTARPRGTDRPGGSTVTLDGRFVTDPPSLYLALGEAVNGPGGYFGSTLDGLRDCLRGGFGASVPFTVEWGSAQVARESLSGRQIRLDAEESYWDAVLSVLAESGVTVELH